MDGGTRLDERVAGADVRSGHETGDAGGVTEGGDVAFKGAEEGGACSIHIAAREGGCVIAVDEQVASAGFEDGSIAADVAVDGQVRAACVEDDLSILNQGEGTHFHVVGVGDVDRERWRTKRASEVQVAKLKGLRGSCAEAIQTEERRTAADVAAAADAGGRANSEVVARKGGEHLHVCGVVTVVADVEGGSVEGDRGRGTKDIGATIGEAEFRGAGHEFPSTDIVGTGSGVAVGEEERAAADFDQGFARGCDLTANKPVTICDGVQRGFTSRIHSERAVDLNVGGLTTSPAEGCCVQGDVVDQIPSHWSRASGES